MFNDSFVIASPSFTSQYSATALQAPSLAEKDWWTEEGGSKVGSSDEPTLEISALEMSRQSELDVKPKRKRGRPPKAPEDRAPKRSRKADKTSPPPSEPGSETAGEVKRKPKKTAMTSKKSPVKPKPLIAFGLRSEDESAVMEAEEKAKAAEERGAEDRGLGEECEDDFGPVSQWLASTAQQESRSGRQPSRRYSIVPETSVLPRAALEQLGMVHRELVQKVLSDENSCVEWLARAGLVANSIRCQDCPPEKGEHFMSLVRSRDSAFRWRCNRNSDRSTNGRPARSPRSHIRSHHFSLI